METKKIRILDFCKSHKIEITFVQQLSDYGLIQLVSDSGELYLKEDELLPLEQFTCWYYDLELNFQGIEVAYKLLSKIKALQQEVQSLKTGYTKPE
ncbi:hypothetical protein HP439_04780 [Sphingobacterium shayense]|uniref:chaperone modulator CbpM n=1 Tax=Sphingobacterium shayense TaxID=626343 RepID=UPI001555092C|nr:chaperone modulator CbpM [Sphingobacterium shayense]NQD70031.1 hypothetical protein [Sphingobacterium shayense]